MVGVLAALVFGLARAQFGAVFLTVGQLLVERGQGGVQLFSLQIAVVQCLMLGEALFAFLQPHFGLFDGFLAVLQLLAQRADLGIVEGQQPVETGIVQLWMQGAPVVETGVKAVLFGLQGLLAFLLCLEVGGQLHQGVARLLQLLVGVALALA